MSWVQVLILIGSIQVLLAIGCYIWLRRKKGKPLSYLELQIYTSSIKMPYELLHQATDGFSLNNLVSEGNCGLVYKGKYSGMETDIAIKVFNTQASDRFITECEAMKKIRHRNIVKIKSTCSSIEKNNKGFTAIVYDFMEHGSLDRWQHSTSELETSHNELSIPQILNLDTRINIAIDVASALDYLHNQLDNPLIHCNLKLSNILLDTNMTAHVSNFRLAKFFTELGSTSQSSFNGFVGNFGYAPPEYHHGNMVSTKGDVYNYGIILLEMLTGKKTTDPMFHENFKLQNFVSNALPDRLNDIIDPFNLHELTLYDAEKEKYCLIMLLEIGVRCAQELPQFRPDIRLILSMLETIRSVFKANTGSTGSFQAAVLMAKKNNNYRLLHRMFKVSYMDLHKATNGFSSANLVGTGGFGSVYKGKFLLRHSGREDGIGTAVAIKVFNLQRRGAVRSFNTEYQTLENIDHPYLVKIITTCTSVDHEGRDFRAILSEFMDHGSLGMWLHPKNKTNHDGPIKPRILNLLARINIALDVACALNYLHRQCEECIIHCDLKPDNILIDKNMSGRIADFGLAISLPESSNMNQCSSTTRIRGTTGYIPPGKVNIKLGIE